MALEEQVDFIMTQIREIIASHDLLGPPYNNFRPSILNDLAVKARRTTVSFSALEAAYDFWDPRTIGSCETELDVLCRNDKLEVPRAALDRLKQARSGLVAPKVSALDTDLDRGRSWDDGSLAFTLLT